MNRFIAFFIAFCFFFGGLTASTTKKKKEKKNKKASIAKETIVRSEELFIEGMGHFLICLLYTSDAADD